jgi:rubrerythrin
MSKTTANLKEAFAGESQANRKYLAFAKKADDEGLPQVAKLFRAAAHAETIHAHAHLRQMKGIGSTAENLKEAVAGETHEFKSMYPAMIADAQAEGDKAAERYFVFANKAEECHANLYSKAAEKMGNLEVVDYYVCSICGHIHEGQPTDKCPICGAAPKAYNVAE